MNQSMLLIIASIGGSLNPYPQQRAPCSRKTNWTPHACAYILVLICILIGTYLVCCFVQGWLPCAVLYCAVLCSRYCCCRYSTTTYILVNITKKRKKNGEKMEKRHVHNRGARFCFLTPHVELFNFDPPDRRGVLIIMHCGSRMTIDPPSLQSRQGGGIWHRPLPRTPY